MEKKHYIFAVFGLLLLFNIIFSFYLLKINYQDNVDMNAKLNNLNVNVNELKSRFDYFEKFQQNEKRIINYNIEKNKSKTVQSDNNVQNDGFTQISNVPNVN